MQDEIIDLVELKERLDGDKDLFFEICDVFFGDFYGHIEAMRSALQSQTYAVIKEHAHTIKGAMANLSVKNGARLAMEIEGAVRDERIDKVEPLINRLVQEIDNLKIYVDKNRNTEIW